MYCLIEFKEKDGGGLAVVSDTWLTPRKKQVYWPPYKDNGQFRKALTKGEEVNSETWKLYDIHRTFYECDDYAKACIKLKKAQVTSDIQSDENEEVIQKRRRIPRKLSYSDSEEEDSCKLPRPPPIKLGKTSTPALVNLLSSTSPEVTPSSSYIASSQASTDTSRDTTLDRAAYETLLKYVLKVKEQNQQILSLLQKKSTDVPVSMVPSDLPINFPLNLEEDLRSLENYLNNKENLNVLILYFSQKGASNELITTVNRTLKHLISNALASQYSYFGKRQKRAFHELKLNELVIGSVKLSCPACSDKTIEDAIKVWLKHAPYRLKLTPM
ncbi:unnamed protein product [Psylliodes chrysocephalus]|uniref:DUF4806 domain-containing protein n=1 Tax=Psylliodes chrysocephalus TaxID=3402493 RepID=A0A9P0CJR3_9CUCU|nr:unnamed protein product [Psylliodes chrysocephala]